MPDSHCTTHFVVNCPICQKQPEAGTSPAVAPPARSQNEPPAFKSPKAKAIALAAEKYARACEQQSSLAEEVKAAKEKLAAVTEKYTQAIESEKAALAELAQTLKEKE